MNIDDATASTMANICKEQGAFERMFAMVTALVQQAAQQHRDGLISEARESAADAGDLLHQWVGDSSAVSALEEFLWKGEDELWEEFMDKRVGRNNE